MLKGRARDNGPRRHLQLGLGHQCQDQRLQGSILESKSVLPDQNQIRQRLHLDGKRDELGTLFGSRVARHFLHQLGQRVDCVHQISHGRLFGPKIDLFLQQRRHRLNVNAKGVEFGRVFLKRLRDLDIVLARPLEIKENIEIDVTRKSHKPFRQHSLRHAGLQQALFSRADRKWGRGSQQKQPILDGQARGRGLPGLARARRLHHRHQRSHLLRIFSRCLRLQLTRRVLLGNRHHKSRVLTFRQRIGSLGGHRAANALHVVAIGSMERDRDFAKWALASIHQ